MPIQGFSTSNWPWILHPPLWCPFSRQAKVARKYSRPFLVQYQWLYLCPSRPFHPLYSREPHPKIMSPWTTMSLPLSPPTSWIQWEHPTTPPSPLRGKKYRWCLAHFATPTDSNEFYKLTFAKNPMNQLRHALRFGLDPFGHA